MITVVIYCTYAILRYLSSTMPLCLVLQVVYVPIPSLTAPVAPVTS